MSAFIVDREHIRFLVEAARLPHHRMPLRWHVGEEAAELLPDDMDGASRVGQLLWNENIKSVQHRYPQDRPEELPGPSDAWPYDYGGHDVIVPSAHPLAVIYASVCYAYQTCEHPEWETSQAKSFLDALERRQVDRLLELHEPPYWHVLDALAAASWRP